VNVHVFENLVEAAVVQHNAEVERAIRRLADFVEKAGWRKPGQLLHELLSSKTSWEVTGTRSGKQQRRRLQTRISIESPYRANSKTDWRGVLVASWLDGNVWRTETLNLVGGWDETPKTPPPETASGGSALDGSPQDATGSEICQLPLEPEQGLLPFPEGNRVGWPPPRKPLTP